jgi:hypothetical protein
MTMLLVFLCVIAEMTAVTAPEGTVDPSTTAVTWSGTAIGTGGTDETGAIEGVNRDTFVLHVTAGDYTGKVIAVKIAWSSGSNDYDLYIYKRNADGADGDLVCSSGGGVPGMSESTVINPATVGTGDFNIIAVYFTNTPGVDQPQGNHHGGGSPGDAGSVLSQRRNDFRA